MNTELLRILIYVIGILLGSLLILLIPLKTLALITTPFTFKTFGIRRIKRWHSHTDTLGNLMLWISVIFAFAAPWIPYSPIIFAVWITFSWLCAVSRAVRMNAVDHRWKKLVVIFYLNMIFGFGLLCGVGAFSYFSLPIRSFLFANDIVSGKGLQAMYYLTSPQPAAYLLQALLLLIPLCSLWGQFKYMRLENTFKARNMFTYIVKYTVQIVVIAAIGFIGQRGIEKVYQVSPELRISSGNTFCPLSYQDLTDSVDDLENEPAQNTENTEQGNSSAESQTSQDSQQPAGQEKQTTDPKQEEPAKG